MPALTPVTLRTARHTAAAAAVVISIAFPISAEGRSIADIYMPEPEGDTNVLPRRPRPAVWLSANITVPCGAPSRAIARALLFVESISSNTNIFSGSIYSANAAIPGAESLSLSPARR